MATKPLKILQASAGSGKTFSLTAHYLTLLLSGDNKYREILAVTFTNKATEEMKTRILEVLHGFATNDPKVDSYREIILKAHPHLKGEHLKIKADLIYRKILHDYSRFSISTIDGFVQKVIRSFAFELGLNANYALEMNTDKVKEELVMRLEQQLDENETILNWIIELALDRINENLSWNYKQELLKLTGEIFQERYQAFEDAVNDIGFENIDEVFKNFVEINKLEIENFKESLLVPAKQAQEIFELSGLEIADLKGKSKSTLLNIGKVAKGDFSKIDNFLKLIDEPEAWGKSNVIDAIYEDINPILISIVNIYQSGLAHFNLSVAFNKNIYYLRLILEIASILKDYREETGNLLISDTQKLLNKFVGEMGENPSFIMEKMGQRYKNFLFDEFQDTSQNQWNSFKFLLINAIAEPSENLTDHLVVGDTKQAIYRWRNGDWNILHQGVKNNIGDANVIEATLDENYRSSKNIIEFNNLIYQALPKQIQNLLNNGIPEEDSQLQAWWKEQKFDQIVTDIYANAQQNLTPFTPAGGTIKVHKLLAEVGPSEKPKAFYEGDFREASLNLIVDEIKDLIENRQYKQNEICVLVRTNNEALETVERLMKAGLDVVSGDALMIANNRAIQLIINTLKVLIGTVKNTALYKANCISLYAQINNRLPNGEDLYALDQKSLSQLSHLLPPTLCENWAKWTLLPLPELIENLIESYQLGHKNLEGPNIHLPYLLAFRDLIARATQQGEKGISSFLNWWIEDGYKKALPSSETADAIQIVTIHKSKGLAYRAVFVPFCNWNLNGKANSIFWVDAQETPYKLLQKIPLKYSGALAKSSVSKVYYEELLYNYMDALNTLYVASTRCKDFLYINIQGKTTATINNVGDLLTETLLNNPDQQESYILDEFELKTRKVSSQLEAIVLEEYPTSSRLSELFVDNLDNPYLDLDKVNQSSIDGRVLHEILSLSNNLEDLEAVIYDFVYTGMIKDEDRVEYLHRAQSVLNQTDIKALYANADEIISEKTIIDASGKSHRPDKLIFKGDKVYILDFKFTKKQEQQHILQVKQYQLLLSQMGYKNVFGFLYYEEKQSLIALND